MNDPYFGGSDRDFAGGASEDALARELDKNETVHWRGKPRLDTGMGRAWLNVLFGIPFTLFSIVWMGGVAWASREGGPSPTFALLMALFGLPFVAAGFALLSTPFRHAARLKRTLYALTNKRAIIIQSGLFGRSVTVNSVRPSDMREISKIVRRNGSGDLVFAHRIAGVPNPFQPEPLIRIGFLGIDEVDRVERLVRERLIDPQRVGGQ